MKLTMLNNYVLVKPLESTKQGKFILPTTQNRGMVVEVSDFCPLCEALIGRVVCFGDKITKVEINKEPHYVMPYENLHCYFNEDSVENS